jgi:hypothetical protein
MFCDERNSAFDSRFPKFFSSDILLILHIHFTHIRDSGLIPFLDARHFPYPTKRSSVERTKLEEYRPQVFHGVLKSQDTPSFDFHSGYQSVIFPANRPCS